MPEGIETPMVGHTRKEGCAKADREDIPSWLLSGIMKLCRLTNARGTFRVMHTFKFDIVAAPHLPDGALAAGPCVRVYPKHLTSKDFVELEQFDDQDQCAALHPYHSGGWRGWRCGLP